MPTPAAAPNRQSLVPSRGCRAPKCDRHRPHRAPPSRASPEARSGGGARLRAGAHTAISRRIVGAGRPDRSGQRRGVDHPYAEPDHRHRRHDEGRHSRARHRHRRQGRGRSVCHRIGQHSSHGQGQGQCLRAARRHQRRRVLPGSDRHAAFGRGGPRAQRSIASGCHDRRRWSPPRSITCWAAVPRT